MAETVKKKRKLKFTAGKIDITFLSIILILLTIGLVMLFSASYAYSLEYYNNSYRFISRQALWAVMGIASMLIFSRIDYHIWGRFAWLIFIAALGLLVVLLVAPPMLSGTDVKRWVVIGPLSFQPSELAKFAIILLFSSLISANYRQMKQFGFVAFLLGILVVTAFLILKEPHVSATLLVLAIGGVLMIVGGLDKKYMIGGGILGVGGIAAFLLSGKLSYVSDKLEFWLDPWKDPTNKGFQTIQSLLAVGSGAIWGRGIGQSRQKYLWVPEPHNDFIFSIVCEELGLIGAVTIIIIFCFLVWRGFYIAMHAKDKFGSLLAMGLTFQVGLQAMLNILVVTNTIPNTGISLPFFSYGGTSLLILLSEMGIVLSVSRHSDVEKL